MRPYRKFPTTKILSDGIIEEDDFVCIESALELRINNEFLVAFICSPGLEKELAIGYLLSSGTLKSVDEIDEIHYSGHRCTIKLKESARLQTQRDSFQIRRIIGTECGAPEILRKLRTAEDIPYVSNEYSIEIESIYEAASTLRKSQEVHKQTGATHGALIQDVSSGEYVVAEDLGRHNAADKAIGLAIQKELEFSNSFLITTGRLTADIVSKCAWTKIPLLISFLVATDAGVIFAKKANLTLIGALKGKKMRLYNHGASKLRDML